MERVEHPFPPVVDANCRVLILGSFPSVRSREDGFFYGHPQNRFWPLLAAVYDEDTPASIPEKKALLLRHRIALWDVIASCEITGSSDSSIRNVFPNDVSSLLKQTGIERIYCNGRRAYDLYCRLLASSTGVEAILLPSTSPANAAWRLERLIEAWQIIRHD